jgi:hypothetical protein
MALFFGNVMCKMTMARVSFIGKKYLFRFRVRATFSKKWTAADNMQL